MKQFLNALLLFGALSFTQSINGQQSQDFGDYVIHYNAINTNLIPAQVAQSYGIQRSSSRALLNVTVLRKVMGSPGTPVGASVTASGTNLTGQKRDIKILRVDDPEGAIYHLGEFPIHNLETYRFDINVKVDGESELLSVKFQQQFYTE